jgi:hypothetical protein
MLKFAVFEGKTTFRLLVVILWLESFFFMITKSLAAGFYFEPWNRDFDLVRKKHLVLGKCDLV